MKQKDVLKDIREKKLEQLYKDLASLHKEAREIRFKIANMEAKDVNQKSKLKKKIAQMWTVIREKEYDKLTNSN